MFCSWFSNFWIPVFVIFSYAQGSLSRFFVPKDVLVCLLHLLGCPSCWIGIYNFRATQPCIIDMRCIARVRLYSIADMQCVQGVRSYSIIGFQSVQRVRFTLSLTCNAYRELDETVITSLTFLQVINIQLLKSSASYNCPFHKTGGV